MRGLQVLAVVVFASLYACDTDSRDMMAPRLPSGPMASIGMDPASGATIETNQDDYLPGELVRVTGHGWGLGETVHLDMTEDPDTHGDVTQDVQADSTGAFDTPFYDVQDHDLGVTFTLTATGQSSGSKATAVFTDGNLTAATLQVREGTCSTAQTNFTLNSTVCAASTITVTGSGQGTAHFVWFPPAPNASFTNTNNGLNGATVTQTTVAGFSGVWTIKVCTNGGCSGSGNPLAQASFTVAPAKVNATIVVNGYSGTYDGLAHGASGGATGSNGEDLSSLLHIGGTFTDVPGGTVHWTFDGNSSYNAASGDVGINIFQAAVTATAGGGAGSYNGSLQSPTACEVSGAYRGGLTCGNNPISVGPGVGTTTISPVVSGTGLSNFAITPVSGSYTINKAVVIATAGGGLGTYNGTPQSPTACVVSGGYRGDLTCENNPISVGPGVGTTTISPTVSGTGLDNFDITSVPGSYTINKAPITATAGGGSKTYNGEMQTPAACQVTGLYVGDLTCSNNPETVGPDVGTTPINPTVHGTGVDNFDVTSVAGSYTIIKAPVTAKAGSGSGTYNGQKQTPSACGVTGTYVGDLSCANDPLSAGPNVGTFAISPTVSGTGLDNFDITSVPGSYTINKAPVTAKAGSGSTTYDGAAHAPSPCAVTGDYTGDLGCSNNPATVGPNAGSTAIGPLVSGTGLDNFDVTSVAGLYTIVRKAASVTPDAKSKFFGNADPTLTGTLSGFLPADNVTASYSRIPGETVGTYTISAALAPAGVLDNYDITYNTAAFRIQAWTLSGFYQPVDMPNSAGIIWNTVKNGSTVPLKFEVFAGSIERSDLGSVKSFFQASVTCDLSAQQDDIEVTTTGGTSLRYDAVAGQFIQNWQTPKQPGSCYRVTMTTQDGSSLTAYFKLK
jgi:MBG domain-containing protein